MKPPPFEYFRPTSLPEALEALGALENGRPLAGGQSLMPMLNLRVIYPEALIDLNRIPELVGITYADGHVVLGAMTRQLAIERSELVRQHLPIMAEALQHVGHRQTRNRGTIGGSICHLDPSAELPTIALLYDAELDIASSMATRCVGMADFMAGYLSVHLEPGEVLTGVKLRPWSPRHSFAFLEHSRRRGDFAIAAVACLVELEAGESISRIALAAGGIAETPIRLNEAEGILQDSRATNEIVERAAATVADRTTIGDIHADLEYRRHVAVTLTRRVILQALQGARMVGKERA